jgi:hypothetical protein
MSTQRRANRTSPAIETDRADVGRRWFRGCGGRAGISIPETRISSSLASDLTAPLTTIIWLAWVWLTTCDELSRTSTFRVATKSLHTDHRFETFAGYESLSSSPPPGGAGGCRLSAQRSTHRSSPPHIPNLPVRSHLRHALPQAPVGEVRWAERYDGKRDLYFQHAA